MNEENLKQQLTALALQRAALKDQLEQTEKTMSQVSFALQAIEANKPKPEPEEPATAE